MLNIKKPAVSGIFYPDNKQEILSQIEYFKSRIQFEPNYLTRAVIVPHAGYVYSGQAAYKGLSCLDKNIKNIFIFAPAHKVYVEGSVICDYDAFLTPLGEVSVNKDICRKLNTEFGLKYFNEAFKDEHAIEVQLPLLGSLFTDFKIIPVLIGKENPDTITKIIKRYYGDNAAGFVISSDLSHFLNYNEAKKVDNITAQMIENTDCDNFNPAQACGSVGICALSQFAKINNYSLIRLAKHNSGDITGDKSRVVGYGSWFLYEGSKNHYIKEHYSDLTIRICKNSIVNKGKYAPGKYPAVFDETGASFITLEKNGNLRGCIGSIIAHRPLVDDLIENACAAAYRDSRFAPLNPDEFDEIQIKASLLSEPVEIEFCDEADLLNKIIPYKDGIIIKDGSYQAVYLPSVWEQLPDKKMFLNSLKQKAGLSENYFSKNFKAYRFYSDYI